MKFHWGHGIVLAALTFVLFISALVYVSMQEKVDLVTSNYYEKELVYQDHIDRERNARTLPDELTLEVQKEAGRILIRFPDGMTRQGLSGEVTFYRPDNSVLDFVVPVQCNEAREQYVRIDSMKPGLWKVMVNWNHGTTPYYFEKRIFIQ